MAARKTHELKVKTGEYQDNQGKSKGSWITVGRVMLADDGTEYWLINRTFNPAGVPDLSGKGGDAVLIRKFEVKNNDQIPSGPSLHERQKANGYAPGADLDEVPF